MRYLTTSKFVKPCAAGLLALALAACGGGGGGDSETIAGGSDPGTTPGVSDTVAPSVSILTPDDDGAATVADTVITLSGQASDNVGINTLRWSNDRGGSGVIAVSTSWRSPGITLLQGENFITVTASDAAGNSRSDSIRVTLSQSGSGAPAGDGVFMVSDDSSLSNPTLLNNATLRRDVVHIFLDPSSSWVASGIDRVEFDCCRDTGNSSGGGNVTVERGAPYQMFVDLSQYAAGSRREVIATVYFNDGSYAAESAEFEIEASGANNTAPTISGSPATSVTVGQTYEFTPQAADADGDGLTFTVQNLPSWASFDMATGHISGSPGNNDVGEYANVTISVTDGDLSSSLAPFTITVVATASSSVTINWTPPTTRTDGTPIGGLDGYRILYGTASGVYPNQLFVNGGLTSYTIDNLTPGTWYVAMKAVDTYGLESALSNEVTKTAQ